MKTTTRNPVMNTVFALVSVTLGLGACAQGEVTDDEREFYSASSQVRPMAGPVAADLTVYRDFNAKDAVTLGRGAVAVSDPSATITFSKDSEVDASVRSTEPRMGTYSLKAVQFMSPAGAVLPGEGWTGGMKFTYPNRYDLDLVQIVEDEFGNTEIGKVVEVNDGYFRLTADKKILFADQYGALIFTMDYIYQDVRFGSGEPEGYLQLTRTANDRAPVEAGHPSFMKLKHQ